MRLAAKSVLVRIPEALTISFLLQVDDEQLVYLQNLILVSNEAVSDAFGVYEEDQDPVRLAESLKQVGRSIRPF